MFRYDILYIYAYILYIIYVQYFYIINAVHLVGEIKLNMQFSISENWDCPTAFTERAQTA